MLELFNRYKEQEAAIAEVVIIGKNLLNKNPSNAEVFKAYFNYLCMWADKSVTDRLDFFREAEITLDFYAENAELDEEALGIIKDAREQLNSIYSDIVEREKEKVEKAEKEIISDAKKNITELFCLKDVIRTATTQKELDECLEEIGKIDAEIEHESLTDALKRDYDELTKDLTELISETMRKLERQKNKIYNQQAVEAFCSAYTRFKSDSNRYKSSTQLRKLATETLFAYDSSRLFNETLNYYSFVYSNIFNRLDDDNKLMLTKCSIECEKKRG